MYIPRRELWKILFHSGKRPGIAMKMQWKIKDLLQPHYSVIVLNRLMGSLSQRRLELNEWILDILHEGCNEYSACTRTKYRIFVLDQTYFNYSGSIRSRWPNINLKKFQYFYMFRPYNLQKNLLYISLHKHEF